MEPEYASKLSGREDFRFLLAILTGVALSVGVTALQTMIGLAAWRLEFLVLEVFWTATFTAVVLVYLSVKYGSVFVDQRIDAPENIGLMVVTIAECAMFIAVTLGPGANLSLRWFISLSAFGFFASCMTRLIRRRLIRKHGRRPGTKMDIYIQSLGVDMRMAMVTSLTAAIYIAIEPHPSALSALTAGVVSLGILISAVFSQMRTRQRVFS